MARRLRSLKDRVRPPKMARVPQRSPIPRPSTVRAHAASPGIGVKDAPQQTHQVDPHPGKPWTVTVFNNDHNTYEEVMVVLMLATGCTAEEAYIEAWEIDHLGKCMVHRSSQEECESAAQVIASIGIRVVAEPDG